MDTVILRNMNRDMAVQVFSHDGDSVQLMPGSKMEVDAKFNWNLPKGVRVTGQQAVPVVTQTAAPESISVTPAGPGDVTPKPANLSINLSPNLAVS